MGSTAIPSSLGTTVTAALVTLSNKRGGISISFDNEQTLGAGTTTADYDRLLVYGIINGNAFSGGYVIKINNRTVAMKYVYSSKYVELNSIIVPAGTTLKITDYSAGSSLPSGSTFNAYY